MGVIIEPIHGRPVQSTTSCSGKGIFHQQIFRFTDVCSGSTVHVLIFFFFFKSCRDATALLLKVSAAIMCWALGIVGNGQISKGIIAEDQRICRYCMYLLTSGPFIPAVTFNFQRFSILKRQKTVKSSETDAERRPEYQLRLLKRWRSSALLGRTAARSAANTLTQAWKWTLDKWLTSKVQSGVQEQMTTSTPAPLNSWSVFSEVYQLHLRAWISECVTHSCSSVYCCSSVGIHLMWCLKELQHQTALYLHKEHEEPRRTFQRGGKANQVWLSGLIYKYLDE